MVLLYPIVENESQRSVFPGRYLQPECEEGLIMILNFAELSYLELDSISRSVARARHFDDAQRSASRVGECPTLGMLLGIFEIIIRRASLISRRVLRCKTAVTQDASIPTICPEIILLVTTQQILVHF
jgi:hypothetical protein